eukprot:375909-Prymnesium_polylepis.2
MSLPRTVVVHVLTVVAHWAVLLSERDDLRRLHAGMDVKTLIARGVAPQLVLLVLYGQASHHRTRHPSAVARGARSESLSWRRRRAGIHRTPPPLRARSSSTR